MLCIKGAVRAALTSTAVLCAGVAGAGAQQAIGGYRAYIGPADLFNSNGVRLSQAWQVIRQDRANVHRFGVSQPGDERDPWFGSGEMRNALEGWLRQGALDAGTSAAVMAGSVGIYVEVLGQGGRASGVRVRLDGPAAAGGGGLGGVRGGGGVVGSGSDGGELIVSPD